MTGFGTNGEGRTCDLGRFDSFTQERPNGGARRLFLLAPDPGEGRFSHRQEPLRLDGRDWSSCPKAEDRRSPEERFNWLMAGYRSRLDWLSGHQRRFRTFALNSTAMT
jgi:hypothetical protein